MQIDEKAIQDRLRKFDFTGVFTQELGWDFPPGNLTLTIAGQQVQLQAVAEKRGLVAYVCPAQTCGCVQDYATRRRIEREVTKHRHQHLIVFTDTGKSVQVWQWVKREPGKPAACREHTFHVGQPGDALIQKLTGLAVSLQDEESLTHVEVTGRVKKAFDVEKVTKKFYDRFQKEHQAFLKLLNGIADEDMQRWYVSVMLNRLMFIYFIQSKGFLGDADRDYLRTKLTESKLRGNDRYYREFLCPLFFEGFAKRPPERSPAMNALLGTVPYLNGGLFLKHQIEDLHGTAIRIPDAAFEKLFEFFHGYRWHLDERPLKADNEINPDVLGYIFEKYINQKQMGAYYTKEDITEYIAKNTIIPFLFDATAKRCPADFATDAPVWRLLREDPDRYIYPAVRRGVVDDEGNILPESALPDFVRKGMKDPKARMFDRHYNLGEAELRSVAFRSAKVAPLGEGGEPGERVTLPTETWREYVCRRQRCLELREKLGKGEVATINDLTTLNLDIRQFAQDAIANSQSPELLAAFFESIRTVTVLDPTCGSGAFLFAALNILEPLYEACLDRMESFWRPRTPRETAMARGLPGLTQRPNASTSSGRFSSRSTTTTPTRSISSSSRSSFRTSSAWTSWRRRPKSASSGFSSSWWPRSIPTRPSRTLASSRCRTSTSTSGPATRWSATRRSTKSAAASTGSSASVPPKLAALKPRPRPPPTTLTPSGECRPAGREASSRLKTWLLPSGRCGRSKPDWPRNLTAISPATTASTLATPRRLASMRSGRVPTTRSIGLSNSTVSCGEAVLILSLETLHTLNTARCGRRTR